MLEWTKQTARDLQRAYANLQQDDGSHLAASVSFYMAVSFFPLLLVLISGIGLVFRFSGWGQDARERLLNLAADQVSPSLAEQLQAVLSNVQEGAAVSGPIGLVTLFLGAMAVFAHFDDALDRIWNIPQPAAKGVVAAVRRVLVDRLRAFLMLISVGVFAVAGFLAATAVSVAVQSASDTLPVPALAWSLIALVPAVALNWLLFTLVYRFLPKVPVRWSEAARGALFASIMWEAGRRLLATFVIGSKFGVYGVVGAFVAIMLWVFYATTILFLGAEYIQVYCDRCKPEDVRA